MRPAALRRQQRHALVWRATSPASGASYLFGARHVASARCLACDAWYLGPGELHYQASRQRPICAYDNNAAHREEDCLPCTRTPACAPAEERHSWADPLCPATRMEHAAPTPPDGGGPGSGGPGADGSGPGPRSGYQPRPPASPASRWNTCAAALITLMAPMTKGAEYLDPDRAARADSSGDEGHIASDADDAGGPHHRPMLCYAALKDTAATRDLIGEIGLHDGSATSISVDSASSKIVLQGEHSEKISTAIGIKQIDRRVLRVKQQFAAGIYAIDWVPSADNPSDLGAPLQSRVEFERLRTMIMGYAFPRSACSYLRDTEEPSHWSKNAAAKAAALNASPADPAGQDE